MWPQPSATYTHSLALSSVGALAGDAAGGVHFGAGALEDLLPAIEEDQVRIFAAVGLWHAASALSEMLCICVRPRCGTLCARS